MTTRPALRIAAAIILLWAASRGILLAAGLWGATHLHSGRAVQSGNLQRDTEGPVALEIWARWDSEWYLLIAEEGYHVEERLAGRRVAYFPADSTGFFPLYPILIRGFGAFLSFLPRPAALLLSAVLVSNAALLGALILLGERVRRTGVRSRHGAAPGEAVAVFSCAALLCFPPSLFLSAVYAESLLLLLTLLCFKWLREERWWSASVAGALASATKPAGLLLIVPALIAVIGAGRGSAARGPSKAASRWASLAIYPAGTALFSLYCARAFGDPLVWLYRQDRWRGAASGPWRAFLRWAAQPQIHGAHGSTVELIFAVIALVLLVKVLRERPVAESLFAAFVVLLPLCSTLWSFGRLSLQAFPLFVALGAWAARHPRGSLVYFIPAIAGSAVLMAYFGAWWWAG